MSAVSSARPRIGVACVCQETNTFSPLATSLSDFESQGLLRGRALTEVFAGTNTEVGGAVSELEALDCEAVPLVRAWAMSSGPISSGALAVLCELLEGELAAVEPLDGLVLALHGALVDEHGASGDLALLRAARRALGGVPIAATFDLHANLTRAFLDDVDVLVGYLTYPHIDQGSTGERAARLIAGRVRGAIAPVTRHAKRQLLIPAEAQSFDGPLGAVRRKADELVAGGRCLDVSLFPVQPWLDVAELGFGVTVTTDADPSLAAELAEELAEAAWQLRNEFRVELHTPTAAIALARRVTRRPVVLSESADSPTSGTAADSPAMVRELLEHGRGLAACVSLVDRAAVARCREIGEGAVFTGEVGCSLERRFHQPVALEGVVSRLGGGSFELTGPAFSGMSVSMGDFAVVDAQGLQVLLTERPAPSFDPAAWRAAGIEPTALDVVVVRSALLFRAAYASFAGECLVLDLPGASTPRLESLQFVRAPRPLYPLERF